MANEIVNLRTTVPGMKTAINDLAKGREAGEAAILGRALADNAYRFLRVVGGDGAGSRTCTGTRVGDTVIAVWSTANATTPDVLSQFRADIVTINTINQLAGSNLTGAPVFAIIKNEQTS